MAHGGHELQIAAQGDESLRELLEKCRSRDVRFLRSGKARHFFGLSCFKKRCLCLIFPFCLGVFVFVLFFLFRFLFLNDFLFPLFSSIFIHFCFFHFVPVLFSDLPALGSFL